jgi:hypothetical protein
LAKLHDRNLQTIAEEQQKEQKRLVADQEKLKKALEKKERADKRAQAAEKKAQTALAQAFIRGQKAKELEADRLRQEAQIQMLRQGQKIPTAHSPKVVEEFDRSTKVSTHTAFTPDTATKSVPASKFKRTVSPHTSSSDPKRICSDTLGGLVSVATDALAKAREESGA